MRRFAATIAFLILLLDAVWTPAGDPVRPTPRIGRTPGSSAAPAPSTSATAVKNDGRFAIVLKDGTQFVGRPQKLDPLPLETDFGNVHIPLKLITGFEPSKRIGAVLVRFKNGDTLTARMPRNALQVTTKYGTISVPLAELASATAGDKLKPPAQNDSATVPTNVLPDPGSLTAFSASIGKTYYFRVTGAITGSIWGTDTYTADSRLATAAVHAGAVKLGATGIVKVTFVPSPPFHTGSVRNGISSSSYGAYGFSYRIDKSKASRRRSLSPRR